MANTYTQIYIHIVFAVKSRQALISRLWKERLHKYITGIIRNQRHKLIAINTMPDHAHIFNQRIAPRGKFGWQEGFGAFSYSHSQIDTVVKYIMNQEEHHRKRTFREEYEAMLKEFAVEYDARYVFDSSTSSL